MRHALHASQGGLLDKLSARVRVFVIAQLQVLPARTGIANASLHSCLNSTLLYLPARTTSSSPAACALLDCAPPFSPYPTPAPLGAHAVSTFHLYHLIFVRFHLSTRAYSSLCNASQLALALSASESNTARPHLAHSFTSYIPDWKHEWEENRASPTFLTILTHQYLAPAKLRV
jgi:hypothetical protein